jgi:hypothetical protein
MLQATDLEQHPSMLVPELCEAKALANDLRHLLVRSEQELTKGGAREHVERPER